MADEPNMQDAQDSLPVQLISKEITTERIASLEQYRNLVLSDLTDKAAAKDIDAKRREVKRVRCLAESICDAEREEAMRTNQKWLGFKSDISKRLKGIENHLDGQYELHEKEIARLEQQRRDALLAARQKRLDDAKEACAEVTIEMIDLMPDEEWDAMITSARRERDRRRIAENISTTLTELGDECSIEEAIELTAAQAEYRIDRARKDKEARDAKAAADAEEKKENERLERVRLERVAMRVRELSELGIFETFEGVSKMTDEKYATELQKARDLREQENEAQRQRERTQLEQQQRFQRGTDRCKTLARLGNYDHHPDDVADLTDEAFATIEQEATTAKEERDAETAKRLQEEQERQEAARQANEAAAEQKRQDDARLERERQEALRPQREAVAAWAQAALDAMPSTPAIDDPDILDTMRQHVGNARLALLDLRDRMSEEPKN